MTNKTKSRQSKSAIHWPTVVLIIGLVILLIPTVAIGLVFLDAFESTGSTLDGNRFTTERQNELAQEQITNIKVNIEQLSYVEEVEVSLNSATLRINASISETVDKTQIEDTANEMMERVFSVASEQEYFTMSGSYKQYDLEIHAFNSLAIDQENFIYFIAHKNSVMDQPMIQLVSDPKNQEFVNTLYDELYNSEEDSEDSESNQDDEGGE